MMKKFLLGFAALFFMASPAHADITIGFIAPLTGAQAKGGEQLQRGAEQAVADINAQGGVNGEKLVLRKADDACDPKQAVAAANQLASAGVKFVVGHYCSGAAIPASKVYMEEGMLLVTPGASNPKLTDEARDVIFRTYGRDDREALAIGQYILKHYRDKKIAIIHDQSAWGYGMAQQLKQNINAGGVNEITFDAITPGQRDYSSIVTKLKTMGAQVVFLGLYDTEAGLVTRQLKGQGADIQVIGGDAMTAGQFWPITGPAGDGVLMSFMPDPRNLPEARGPIDALRKQNYEPEGDTLYSYAAVQVVAEGIKRAGRNDALKVAAALRQSPVDTVLGTIGFDAKGDVTGENYVMYRWHDGKYAEVKE